MSEAALIMATGARPDGEWTLGDLGKLSEDGKRWSFDPNHPLLNALKILEARGIRPTIDLGAIPRSLAADTRTNYGPFGWITAGPADYHSYYQYIKSLFLFLSTHPACGLVRLNAWTFQLYREPDNHEVWDPNNIGKSVETENLQAYMRLFDHTLAGMRAAGVKSPLQPGNLMVPLPGWFGFRKSWTLPLLKALADTTRNFAPGLLQMPRYRPIDTLRFSFSAYGGRNAQLSFRPEKLIEAANGIRKMASTLFPHTPVTLTVGEGGLLYDGILHRGEVTELGAAWQAAIIHACLRAGISRYQQWGFVSAPHASMWWENKGVPSASFAVVRLLSPFQNGGIINTHLEGKRIPSQARLGGMGIRKNGKIGVLAYAFHPKRGIEGGIRGRITITGLLPHTSYNLEWNRVDANHGNYHPHWMKIVAEKSITLNQPYDACMEYQFDEKARNYWSRSKNGFLEAAHQTRDFSMPTIAVSDSTGRIRLNSELNFNGVLFLILKPGPESKQPDHHPSNG